MGGKALAAGIAANPNDEDRWPISRTILNADYS
jgi:hypothetical protein